MRALQAAQGSLGRKIAAGVSLVAGAATLSAVCVMAGGGSGAAAGSPQIDHGLGINGVFIDHVQFNGKMMTENAFDQLADSYNSRGVEVYTFADSYMSKTGYTLATTSSKQQASWIAASVARMHAAHLTATSRSASVAPVANTSAASVDCSVYYNGDFNQTTFYTGSNCTGNLQVVAPGSRLATVWYNDSYTTAQLGCATSSVTVYEDANFPAGKSHYFGNSGGTTPYDFRNYYWPNGRNMNDTIGSLTSVASGLRC